MHIHLVHRMCLSPQSVVSGVTTAYNREQLWLANESLITKLQARCRGYLVRKGLRQRMEYLKSNEPAATNIQVRRNGDMKTRGGVLTLLVSLCAGSLEGLQAEEEVPRQATISEGPQRRRGQGDVRQGSPPVLCRNVLIWPKVTFSPLRSSPWSGCIRLARSTGIDSSTSKTMWVSEESLAWFNKPLYYHQDTIITFNNHTLFISFQVILVLLMAVELDPFLLWIIIQTIVLSTITWILIIIYSTKFKLRYRRLTDGLNLNLCWTRQRLHVISE